MFYLFSGFLDISCTNKTKTGDESLANSSFNLKQRSSSLGSARPKTAPSKPLTTPIDEEETLLPEDVDLIHYLYYISRQRVGLQHNMSKTRPPTEFRQSYNLNHPELRRGQKIYLNNLCQIYSIKDLIHGTKKQFSETLENRKTTGKYSEIKVFKNCNHSHI